MTLIEFGVMSMIGLTLLITVLRYILPIPIIILLIMGSFKAALIIAILWVVVCFIAPLGLAFFFSAFEKKGIKVKGHKHTKSSESKDK